MRHYIAVLVQGISKSMRFHARSAIGERLCDDQVTYWARAARMHCLHARDVLRTGTGVLVTLGVDVPCNRYIVQSHRNACAADMRSEAQLLKL